MCSLAVVPNENYHPENQNNPHNHSNSSHSDHSHSHAYSSSKNIQAAYSSSSLSSLRESPHQHPHSSSSSATSASGSGEIKTDGKSEGAAAPTAASRIAFLLRSLVEAFRKYASPVKGRVDEGNISQIAKSMEFKQFEQHAKELQHVSHAIYI